MVLSIITIRSAKTTDEDNTTIRSANKMTDEENDNIDTDNENEDNTTIRSANKMTDEENDDIYISVEKELMRMMYYHSVTQATDSKYYDKFSARVLNREFSLLEVKHLDKVFVNERIFTYKYYYAGASARYMFDFPVHAKVDQPDEGIIPDVRNTLDQKESPEIASLFNGFTAGRANCTESRLRVQDKFADKKRTVENQKFTSAFIEEYLISKSKNCFQSHNAQDLLDVMLESSGSRGEMLDGLFFQALKESKSENKPFQLKYLGVYENVHDGYIQCTDCATSVASDYLRPTHHRLVIDKLATENNTWIKLPNLYPGWDAAFLCEKKCYLLLLQITLSKTSHDISFQQVDTVLKDLKRENVCIENLELAYLFPDQFIAENIKLQPKPPTKANISLGGINVVHGFFTDKFPDDEEKTTWVALGKNKGLQGIGMYIPKEDLFKKVGGRPV